MKKIARYLVALLLLGVCVPAHALTLSDIRVTVRQTINDRSDPQLTYSNTILNLFINEGQRDLVNQTWCLQKTTSQSLSVATTYYTLPSDLLAIQEFTFLDSTGRKRQLEEKSERGIYQSNPDYERQVGPPFYYFVRRSTSTGTSLEYGINPIPSTASATGTVFVKYYNQATDLSVSTDVALGGFKHLYPYHSALVYYTVAKIKMLEGNTVAAESYMKLYQMMVALMVDRLGRMPNYNPSFGGSSQ